MALNEQSTNIMADRDAASVRRQQSMKNREFTLYATRVRPHAKHVPASEIPGPAPDEDDHFLDDDPALFIDDAPPQLPPLPISPLSPISPRWDSLANGGSNFIYQKSADQRQELPLADSTRYHHDESQAPAPKTAHDDSAGVTWPSEQRSDLALPHASNPNPTETRPAESSLVGNFSRPRKPSIKQPVQESSRQRPQPESVLDTTSSHSYAWPRERGQSGSSVKSAWTFASSPLPLSAEIHDARIPRPRNATQPPTLSPLALAYNRAESTSTGHTRETAPWVSGDEVRSSFRSQLTVSTAQGTYTTERSSVLTKGSSITSIYASLDELSVEDVMGLYEKGFGDDSGVEDHDEPSRPHTARSEHNRRQTRVLEAVSEPMPAPSRPFAIPTAADHVVRDSAAIFRNSGLPSSLPKDVGLANYGRKSMEKRDSAKSLAADHPSTIRSDNTTLSAISSDAEHPSSRDRYGFKKDNHYITREQYDHWNAEYSDYLLRRRKKWVLFLKDSGLMTDHPQRFPLPSAKTKRFIRKGIPPDWRGAAWFYYAGGPAILAKHSGLYAELVQQQAKEVDVEAIERDLHRTFPDNVRFKPPANETPSVASDSERSSQHTLVTSNTTTLDVEPEMISSLRRVLHAFSLYNPRIGYCQSLNFLAGLLLLFVETEEQCFWLLNVITRVYLPGTHEMSLEGSKIDLGVLMGSLKESMPAVYAKIGGELDGDTASSRPVTRGKSSRRSKSRHKEAAPSSTDRLPPITLCMTAWFMSCFIGTLPIESTLRVWDIFFYEGSKTLFRIALAIFKLGEAEIKAVSDPMEMFSVVQAMPRRLLDANAVIDACFKRRNGFGHLSQETIEEKREERRGQGRKENEELVSAGVRAVDGGHATNVEGEVRRKGTLFGRRKRRDVSRGRPTEVI
jgi:TBC1 domain family member 6